MWWQLKVQEDSLLLTRTNLQTLQEEHDAELTQLNTKILALEEDAKELTQQRATVASLELELANYKPEREALKEKASTLSQERYPSSTRTTIFRCGGRSLVMEMLQPGNCSALPFKELGEDWQPLVELVMRVPDLEAKNKELSQVEQSGPSSLFLVLCCSKWCCCSN